MWWWMGTSSNPLRAQIELKGREGAILTLLRCNIHFSALGHQNSWLSCLWTLTELYHQLSWISNLQTPCSQISQPPKLHEPIPIINRLLYINISCFSGELWWIQMSSTNIILSKKPNLNTHVYFVYFLKTVQALQLMNSTY